MEQSDRKAKCLYILQITQEKMNKDSMKTLKCLLFEMIRMTKTEHIVLEVWFGDEFQPVDEQLGLIVKMLVNGYNLLEPEHSRHFPLLKLEILLP